MRTMNAHELLATADCVVPLCMEEAEPGRVYCRHHIAGLGESEGSRVPNANPPSGSPKPDPFLRDPFSTESLADVRTRVDAILAPKEKKPVSKRLYPPEKQEQCLTAAVEQARAFHAKHGRWPLPVDTEDHPDELPSRRFCEYIDGGWARIWEAVGAGPLPRGRAAASYRVTGVFPAALSPAVRRPSPAPPPAASATASPKPKETAERLSAPPAPSVEDVLLSPQSFTDAAEAFEKAAIGLAALRVAFQDAQDAYQAAYEAVRGHPLLTDADEDAL